MNTYFSMNTTVITVIKQRLMQVNETKSDGYRPKERGPLDSGRDRDRDMDRGRAPTDSYPPHTDSGRKFRISINNLPEHFTWRELKDFLRTGAQSVSYANVNHAGFGYVWLSHLGLTISSLITR